MNADSVSVTGGVGGPLLTDKISWLAKRVGDVREDFGRRIQEISSKSASDVAGRLQLAYYQAVLTLFESLPSETRLHSGWGMSAHLSRHPKEVRETIELLDYLTLEDRRGRRSVPRVLPASVRRHLKKGRPATRRPAAVRALQMKIDTNRTWAEIASELCHCTKRSHDGSCKESIRQSVMTLRRRLPRWGITLP
jgi:hypothetical protein